MSSSETSSVSLPGSELRRRRLELGLSQARLAGLLGVSPTLIGRWERGDEDPGPERSFALARALEIEEHEIAVVVDDPGSPKLSVHIVTDPGEPQPSSSHQPSLLAPPLDIEPADPWGLPSPSPRRGVPAGDTLPLAVPRDEAPSPPLMERDLRRRARIVEQRVKREVIAARRTAQERAVREARLRRESETAGPRTGAIPMVDPGSVPALPGGAANTGSVFPVPDTRRRSERVTYRARGPSSGKDARFRYSLRAVLTTVLLLLMAALLIWALIALGDGLGAAWDVFRGGDKTEAGLEAVGLQLPGLLGWRAPLR